jgi:mRNA interferase RelE/StbE
MEYRVEVKDSAIKELARLQEVIGRRVLNTLESLVSNPRPKQCCKLVETACSYRLRVGDYRILYQIDDKSKTITVFRIAHRREVYRK